LRTDAHPSLYLPDICGPAGGLVFASGECVLIADGYAHSLKTLLEQSSAEERAARRGPHAQVIRILVERVIDWIGRDGLGLVFR